MLLSEVVTTSTAVAATRSRLAKVAALADLLRHAAASPSPAESSPASGEGLTTADRLTQSGESRNTTDRLTQSGESGNSADQLTGTVLAVVSFLVGRPRQGRIGAGWRTLVGLDDVPPAGTPALTVERVDAVLGEVAAASGRGAAARRAEALRGLLAAATAPEQDFLRRLLAGELRQGALEGVMLDAVASAAGVPVDAVRRAFMLSGQLPETAAAALTGGAAALAGFRLAVGRPVRPMLASPAQSLPDALTELGECVVEYKLDGARIQVHRDGDVVRVFTRSLRDITRNVPELVEVVRALPCRSVVLDGETLALRPDGRPRPFQETMSRFGSEVARARDNPTTSADTDTSADTTTSAGSADEAAASTDPNTALLLHPYFFDCLSLDGVDLLDLPLRERLAALERVAGRFRVPSALGTGPELAAEILDAALAAGHEGVVVKSLAAPYAAGRRGRAWQKVKPEHTLDLVVLAAEWGHGRRSGYLSNLHLGARDPDGGPPIMVGKTFKGLTDELLAWQTSVFPTLRTRATDWLVELRPELVVEIELDGVQVSPRYPGGVALRFARVLRYRPDKNADEADTIDAVRALLPGAAEGAGP
ncbi:ATP-dependent DNA ligase [Goodfellowiella coeruleoviolacea]|uniref:ATP-dependent DNA ligase n=1 Tax=Goodfellowiella coeruleoviolacea TaxID=334858 RepID=UPI0027DFF1AC|nr:ATP-dependent DNA ligase [Goodfellowiella coeruleoviolacea]